MKKSLILACCLAAIAAIGTEVLTVDENSFNGTGKITLNDGIFNMEGNCNLYYRKKLPVDTSSEYRLSGEFRATEASGTNDFIRLGLLPLTDKRIIGPSNINIVKDTDTELAADCVATDTVLKVRDASKWKASAIGAAAFNTDPSGKLRDLPNFDLSPVGIESIEKRDDIWLVKLKAPCGKNHPAGTPIREHQAGWSLIYAGSAKYQLTNEWVKLESIIPAGEVTTASIKNWWKGTRHTTFNINLSGKSAQFRNLKLEKIK